MGSAPFTVTGRGGQTALLVMDKGAPLPASFALMGTTAREKRAIRLCGGCKGMNADDKSAMLAYFADAFAGYGGVLFSGGTRQTKDGQTDPMVTDIPVHLREVCPGAVVLGTLPRTDMFRLVGESRFVLDGYGTAPNPGYDGIAIVQDGAEGKMGWDGDVAVYLAILSHWKEFGGFTAVGTVSWNGGPVTVAEIMQSAARGWATILVKGSGRGADEVIAKFESGDAELMGKLPSGHKVVVVSKDDPAALRTALVTHGFLDS